MSFIVLEFELADINVNKESGFFLIGKFRDTHFALQKCTNSQNKHSGVQEL